MAPLFFLAYHPATQANTALVKHHRLPWRQRPLGFGKIDLAAFAISKASFLSSSNIFKLLECSFNQNSCLGEFDEVGRCVDWYAGTLLRIPGCYRFTVGSTVDLIFSQGGHPVGFVVVLRPFLVGLSVGLTVGFVVGLLLRQENLRVGFTVGLLLRQDGIAVGFVVGLLI